MKQGTQIAYIPTHANGDIKHPDVEFGFVMAENEDTHFCRYWRKGNLGELRTRANSEATPNENLVEHQSVRQTVVDYWIKVIAQEEAKVGVYDN
jgi:hypothetical protein